MDQFLGGRTHSNLDVAVTGETSRQHVLPSAQVVPVIGNLAESFFVDDNGGALCTREPKGACTMLTVCVVTAHHDDWLHEQRTQPTLVITIQRLLIRHCEVVIGV